MYVALILNCCLLAELGDGRLSARLIGIFRGTLFRGTLIVSLHVLIDLALFSKMLRCPDMSGSILRPPPKPYQLAN